jgi:hypothetical protein
MVPKLAHLVTLAYPGSEGSKRKRGVRRGVPGKTSYRIRPDEIGRDFFRTLCEKAGVPTTIAEYSLGHKIDSLEYNKFYNTEEGKTTVRQALEKVRPLVNVVSGKGTPAQAKESYFEEASRLLAVMKDKPLEEVREAMVLEALAMGKLAKRVVDETGKVRFLGATGKIVDIYALDRDTLFPVVLSVAQKLTTTPKKPKRKVVSAEEVQKWIDDGWSFRSSVNGHFALVERDE